MANAPEEQALCTLVEKPWNPNIIIQLAQLGVSAVRPSGDLKHLRVLVQHAVNGRHLLQVAAIEARAAKLQHRDDELADRVRSLAESGRHFQTLAG